MDLYSNAIIVSRKFVKEHPEAVKGFLKALNHGIKDAIADPQAAIDAVDRARTPDQAGRSNGRGSMRPWQTR